VDSLLTPQTCTLGTAWENLLLLINADCVSVLDFKLQKMENVSEFPKHVKTARFKLKINIKQKKTLFLTSFSTLRTRSITIHFPGNFTNYTSQADDPRMHNLKIPITFNHLATDLDWHSATFLSPRVHQFGSHCLSVRCQKQCSTPNKQNRGKPLLMLMPMLSSIKQKRKPKLSKRRTNIGAQKQFRHYLPVGENPRANLICRWIYIINI
jgi:hypothetical protein